MEYGNYFDVMGLFGYSLNFNGFFKEKLGWIGSSQKELIRNSGIYTINPLEFFGRPKSWFECFTGIASHFT